MSSGIQPVAVYAMRVPPGDIMIPAVPEFAAMFRLTMAAIDPSAEPELEEVDSKKPPRATLKVVRVPDELLDSDDEDDEDDEDYEDFEDEEDDEEDDEEENGGPSNKSKKAALLEALAQDEEDDEDEDMEDDEDEDEDDEDARAALAKLIKSAKAKGKGKALEGDEEDEEEDSEEDSESGIEMDEIVLCTLDPEKHYQQPLDFTVGEGEKIFFKVSGTHTVYLTGNYVIPIDDGRVSEYDSEDEDLEDMEGAEYDLSPDEDELEGLEYDVDEESDELDDLDDPRVTEVASDDEAPNLIPVATTNGKGKNKRPAADDESDDDVPAVASLDDIMAKALKQDSATVNEEKKKLTKAEKKAAKKMKKNDGEAAPVESAPVVAVTETVVKKDAPNGTVTEKKVQFAKNLEQGPTPSATPPATKAERKKAEKEAKKAAAAGVVPEKKDEVALKADSESKKADAKADKKSDSTKPSVRNVQGVTVDERKVGSGPVAKKGSRLEMRYIGKLKDGKVFDSNKSGKPFSFQVGKGEVIKGWDLGLMGMQAGGERRLVVPANLAYGSKALPGIPKGSELTFDVKCLSVK